MRELSWYHRAPVSILGSSQVRSLRGEVGRAHSASRACSPGRTPYLPLRARFQDRRTLGTRHHRPKRAARRTIRSLRQLDTSTSNARKHHDGVRACRHVHMRSPRHQSPRGSLMPREALIKSWLPPLSAASAHKYCTDILAFGRPEGVPSARRNISIRPGQALRLTLPFSRDGTVGVRGGNKILRHRERSQHLPNQPWAKFQDLLGNRKGPRMPSKFLKCVAQLCFDPASRSGISRSRLSSRPVFLYRRHSTRPTGTI